jgi:hypothetical protein
VLVLVGALAVHAVPQYRRGGWPALVPATVSIACLPWTPRGLLVDSGSGNNEDWTLSGRIDGNKLFGWQERWLRGKAARIAGSTRSLSVLGKVLPFVDESERALQSRVAVLLARAVAGQESAADAGAILDWLAAERGPNLDEEVAEFVPGLRRILSDPASSPDEIDAAIRLLLACSAGRDGCARELVAAMGRGSVLSGMGIAVSIGYGAQASEPIRRALLAAAIGDDPVLGLEALNAVIGASCPVDDAMGECLLGFIAEGGVRARPAARLLARQGWRPERTIPILLAQVESGNPLLYRIADYGVALRDYLPQLIDLTTSADPAVRLEAAQAIEQMAEDGILDLECSIAYPAIKALEADPSPPVQSVAAAALATIQPRKPK